ncbi:hypothetical protein GUJ93_ZPchr0012g20545 [Zizania palustris]|uniref:Protein TIFY n=1 Tax=Zizania palustris TaxID=103762 RepID=A0A8J5WU78_ZIZPA|nr:hypothetical protein GUJ93_ZPchr0012g20545 [Zizania palustris]
MTQLTIFYADSVNAFNNISPEKAQEIMFLASRGSLPNSSITVARMPEALALAPAKLCLKLRRRQLPDSWRNERERKGT